MNLQSCLLFICLPTILIEVYLQQTLFHLSTTAKDTWGIILNYNAVSPIDPMEKELPAPPFWVCIVSIEQGANSSILRNRHIK